MKEIVSLKKKMKLKRDLNSIKKFISNKIIISIIKNTLKTKKRVILIFANIIKYQKINNSIYKIKFII